MEEQASAERETQTKRHAASNLSLRLCSPGYLGITNTEQSSGQTGRPPRSDLTRNGTSLIFPGHMTRGTQIKSLLFTVTFPFSPSLLGEIFAPSAAVGADRPSPPKQKKPSGRVTQSQYGRLVLCLKASHRNLCVIAPYIANIRKEKCDLVWELVINDHFSAPGAFPTKCRLTVFINVKWLRATCCLHLHR